MTMQPYPNVAHEAGPDGRCVRCRTMLGANLVLDETTGVHHVHLWTPGQLVLEYDVPGGRTAFTDSAAGPRVTCVS